MGKTQPNDKITIEEEGFIFPVIYSRLEKLVDLLIEGRINEIFEARKIPINITSTRMKKKINDYYYEIDIIAGNWNEVILVEVRTILGIEEVQNFVDKLKIFKEVITGYENYIAYGSIAYLNENSEAEKFAQSIGLFTIKATGDSALITNTDDFKPKEW